MSVVVECPDCPGCLAQLLYPHQHRTECPVFRHADIKHECGCVSCGCGERFYNYTKHFDHLRRVWRDRQFELIGLGA